MVRPAGFISIVAIQMPLKERHQALLTQASSSFTWVLGAESVTLGGHFVHRLSVQEFHWGHVR